jgi:hypothetical protein
VNTSFCGCRYLLRYFSTSRCTFGRWVGYLSTKISGTSSTYMPPNIKLVQNTHGDAPHGGCFCKSYIQALELRNVAHSSLASSYPLGYAIVILPISTARWSLFDHKEVPTAVVFLAVSIANLEGAINVLLLFIVRPQLLLLTRPECKVNMPMHVGIETEQIILEMPKSLESPSFRSQNSQTSLRPLRPSPLALSSHLSPPPSLYSQSP